MNRPAFDQEMLEGQRGPFAFLGGFPDGSGESQFRLSWNPKNVLSLPYGHSDPFSEISEFIDKAGSPTFALFSYDLKNSIEQLPSPKPPHIDLPIFHAVQFRENIHLQDPNYVLNGTADFRAGQVRPVMTREAYIDAVEKSLQYIAAGDIYQVNICQRFQFPFSGSIWGFFSCLYRINPAQFAFFLDAGDFVLAVCSPERLLKRTENTLESRPIKGTRPRGMTRDEDKRQLVELLQSEKEQAELTMITDLHRNDMGRISEFGSVKVISQRHVCRMANVFHTESIIRSQCRQNESLESIFRAMLPGGSVTGCPKIRAMEIIDQLEPIARQFYTGAVGFFDCSTQFDLAMTIRCITFHRPTGQAWFDVGSGIVADSVPELEYEETLHKAGSIMKILEDITTL